MSYRIEFPDWCDPDSFFTGLKSCFHHLASLAGGGTSVPQISLLRFLVVPLLLITSACTVHQTPLEEIDGQSSAVIQQRWQEHEARMSALQDWRIRGKIAVRAGSKGGHATLRWDRSPETQHIELAGPLGGGRVVIDADSQGAHLQDTRGGNLRGDSVSELVELRLGWPLPFEQLPQWIRGLPAGEDAKLEWDDEGRIVRMNDSGWQLSYPAYQSVSSAAGEPLPVPRQVELNALPGTLRVYDKDGKYLGEDFFVRLIVKSWLP